MASKGMQGKEDDVEEQWVHKVKELSREQLMEVVGRCAEIAVRIIFENFTYNFGGKIYLQREGGPIGARITMACSRLVMQDWGECYRMILREAGLWVTLLKIYVDDVRQVSSTLRKGTRFDEKEKKMTWTKEAENEDIEMEEMGENKDARMARILRPAMNSINKDLRFTTEVADEFEDKKLPTLDFKLWLENDNEINHTFYEKSMKTQLVIPKRSAMSMKQKMSINSNDLNRRLSNINIERMEEGELERVTNHYTKQLKGSGYTRNECREIIVSGALGWKRRMARRLEENKEFYRSAASTLRTRIKKKLDRKSRNWLATTTICSEVACLSCYM